MANSFLICADGLLRCQAFRQFSWLGHAFGTRHVNPSADVTLRQVHSNLVLNAHNLKDRQQDGDALITDEIGLRIAVRTADCVPILAFDSKLRTVAAVHAGWRGSADEITNHTIQRMSVDFTSRPANIWAAIGPCIRECCYEVGPEVWTRFQSSEEGGGKRYLDLAGANRRQLEAAGVPPAQIFDCGVCTACRFQGYFSFRREALVPGRMLSAITRLD